MSRDDDVTVSTVEAELARAVKVAADLAEKLRRFQSRAMALAHQRADGQAVPLDGIVRAVRQQADFVSEAASDLHQLARRITLVGGGIPRT